MVASVDAPERMFGKAIKRREDPRLITGTAAFLDDIKLPGMSHAALLRSPHGHARIRSIDTSAAAAAPGIIGVFTGEDFSDLNPLPCAWQAGGVQNNVNTPRVLAIGEVHQVGDPIAVVVAEDAEAACDALFEDRIAVYRSADLAPGGRELQCDTGCDPVRRAGAIDRGSCLRA